MAKPQWNMRVSEDLDKKVSDAAALMGITKTEVIRYAVSHFVGTMFGALDKFGTTMQTTISSDLKEKLK